MVRVYVLDSEDEYKEELEEVTPLIHRRHRRAPGGSSSLVSIGPTFRIEDLLPYYRQLATERSLNRPKLSVAELHREVVDLVSTLKSDSSASTGESEVVMGRTFSKAELDAKYPLPPRDFLYKWVDREVSGTPSIYLNEKEEIALRKEIQLTEGGANDGDWILRRPEPEDRACSIIERSPWKLICYEYIFRRLKVRIPFSAFQESVLQHLRLAPSQLHVNGWAYVRAFERFFEALGLTPSYKLFFYLFQVNRNAGISGGQSWISLRHAKSRKIFSPYTDSYKGFKSRFFLVEPSPEHRAFYLSADGNPISHIYWTEEHGRRSPGYYSFSEDFLQEVELKIFKLLVDMVELHGPFSS